MAENSKYMESLGAKTQLLKAEFQKLILGDGGLNSFLKTLTAIGIGLLKFANSDVGQLTLKLGLLILTTNSINKAVTISGTKMVLFSKGMEASAISTAAASGANVGFAKSVGVLTKSFIANAIAWATTPMGMATIAIGSIFAITKAYDTFNVTVEEQVDALKESSEKAKESKTAYDSIKTSLEEIRAKIKEINAEDMTIAEKEQLNLLLEQENSLMRQLELSKQKAEIDREAQEKKSREFLETSDTNPYARVSDVNVSSSGVDYTYNSDRSYESPEYVTPTERIEEATKRYKELQDQLDIYTLKLQEIRQNLGEESKEFRNMSDGMSTVRLQMSDLIKENMSYVEGLELASASVNQETESGKALKSILDNLIDGWFRTTSASYDAQKTIKENGKGYEYTSEELDELGESLGMNEEELQAYLSTVNDTTNSLSDLTQGFDDVIDSLGEMEGIYSSLTSIVDEFNSTNGQLSLESLDKLLSMSDEYLSLLEFENGQASINQEGLEALANARIDEAEAKAYNVAMAELDAIANEGLSTSLTDVGNSGVVASNGIAIASNAVINSALNAINSVFAWNKFHQAMLNQSGLKNATNDQKTRAKVVTDSLKNQLNALEGARKSIGSYTSATNASAGATGGSTKATKENTDALKEQKKVLDDTISDYDRVIKYINAQLDKRIDKLEEEKDVALDSIKSQIESLKEKRDNEEQYWDDKINALEAQNDAISDQLRLEELLKNLEVAKSKRVKVYKEGQGFVYDKDYDAISQAKSELDEYKRSKKLKDQIAELEKNRDDKLKIYDKQIKDLENQSAKVEKEYDEQIKFYKDWKNKFSDMVDAYDNEQDRLLTLQLTGIDFEKDNWETRLDNLAEFIAKYKKHQEELARITEQINNSASSSSSSGGGGGGGGGYGGGDVSATPQEKPYTVFRILSSSNTDRDANTSRALLTKQGAKPDGVMKYNNKYVVFRKENGTYNSASDASNKASQLTSSSQGRNKYGYKQFSYASGVAEVKDDQWAITGENPNKEIVLGSKLNNGTMTKIGKKGGVINAKGTTLAGLFNSLSSNNLNGKYGSNSTNNNSNVTNINIANLNVDTQDGEGLVSYLQNFSLDMTQRAYI